MDGQFFPGQAIQFVDGPSVALPAYRAGAAHFDATNDYLTRGAGLTGVVDGKLLTGSFWIKPEADGVTGRIVFGATAAGGGTESFAITKQTLDRIQIVFRDTGATVRLNVTSTTDGLEAADGWRHILFSFDMTDTAKRWLYVQDASDLTVASYTDATLDFTAGDVGIGGTPSAANKFQGDLADMLIWFGTYLDLSVTANRRLFISAGGKPVRPLAAIASLGEPAIKLTGAADGWEKNYGTGGGLTENGALTDAATSPSD